MATTNEKVLGAVIAGLLIITVAALLIASYRISNTGKIRTNGLNIYADSYCTIQLKSIDWGLMSPGDSKGQVLYCRPEGNVNVTLSYSTSDWIPASAASYLSTGWNYTAGSKIQPFEVRIVLFTLTVSPTIVNITNFSFTATINATQVA